MASWLKVTLILYALEPAPRFGLRHPFSQALITVYKVRQSDDVILRLDLNFGFVLRV